MTRRLATVVWFFFNMMAFVAGLQFLPPVAGEKAMALFLGLNFCSTLLHEIGHAVAGLRLGASIRVFSVWGISYKTTNRRFELQKSSTREIAGCVQFVPRLGQTLTLYDNAKIAVAGPAVNILTSILAIGFVEVEPSALGHGAAVIFAIMSVGMAVTNLIPFSGSDGFIIRRFLAHTAGRNAR